MQDALEVWERQDLVRLWKLSVVKRRLVNPITLNLSVPEIEAQYNDIVNRRLTK